MWSPSGPQIHEHPYEKDRGASGTGTQPCDEEEAGVRWPQAKECRDCRHQQQLGETRSSRPATPGSGLWPPELGASHQETAQGSKSPLARAGRKQGGPGRTAHPEPRARPHRSPGAEGEGREGHTGRKLVTTSRPGCQSPRASRRGATKQGQKGQTGTDPRGLRLPASPRQRAHPEGRRAPALPCCTGQTPTSRRRPVPGRPGSSRTPCRHHDHTVTSVAPQPPEAPLSSSSQWKVPWWRRSP